MNGYGTATASLTLPPSDPAWRRALDGMVPDGLTGALAAGPVTLERLPGGARVLDPLWLAGYLQLADGPEARLIHRSAPGGSQLAPRPAVDDDRYALSRFAFLRRSSEGLAWETPLAPGRLLVRDTATIPLAAAFGAGATLHEIAADDLESTRGLVTVLVRAGVLQRCDRTGQPREETDPAWRQWEFHDLLFHRRTRMGYHDEPAGAHYRWRGLLSPQPALKVNRWAAASVSLPPADLPAAWHTDPPLATAMEARVSGRDHDPQCPVTVAELGAFLFRAARVRGLYATDAGEFTSRPYPSGGGSYELEIYVTANQCVGLQRGFYYYDPLHHALSHVAVPDADMEGLLNEAWQSAALTCRPQVLLTIASRFHRVGWKYSSIAYATQLKNVGVLIQTFYLVATATRLAGCALGLGNIERFARLTGLDPMVEGSVGEFMLGGRAPGS